MKFWSVIIAIWFLFFSQFFAMWEDGTTNYVNMREISWDITNLIMALYVASMTKWRTLLNVVFQLWVLLAIIQLINTIAGIWISEFSNTLGLAATITVVSGFFGVNILKWQYYHIKLIMLKSLYKTVIFFLKVSDRFATVYKRLNNEIDE